MQTETSIVEHFDLFQTVFASMAAILGWFLVRTLNSIEKSISILFKKYEALDESHDKLSKDFNRLSGEHIATHAIRSNP